MRQRSEQDAAASHVRKGRRQLTSDIEVDQRVRAESQPQREDDQDQLNAATLPRDNADRCHVLHDQQDGPVGPLAFVEAVGLGIPGLLLGAALGLEPGVGRACGEVVG